MLANPDVVIPLNIANEYQSSGTSYAAFEIVFDASDGSFFVQRPGGNRSGPHLEYCPSYADFFYLEDACTDQYHSVWPPIIPGDCE